MSTQAPRAYRGQYPHRIASVGTADRHRTIIVQSNAGQVMRLDQRTYLASSGGKMPRVGQDIRECEFAEAKAVTYTVLVTITGRQPADLQALADRIRNVLETGTAAGAAHESATVDVIPGDRTELPATKADEPLYSARRLHRDIRTGR